MRKEKSSTNRRYIEGEKANYTNQYNRENTSIIFKARNRMLNIKRNFKNKYQNQTCRLCNLQEETQEHRKRADNQKGPTILKKFIHN